MRTKKIIIDTVIKLIKTKDLQELSVQKICEEAGVSKGTFYNHFKDKYDVLHVFYNDFLIDNHIMDNEEIRFDKDTYIDKWKVVIHFFKENGELMRILFKDHYQNSFSDYWSTYLNPKSYIRAIERNHIEDTRINKYLVNTVMEAQTSIMKEWVMNDCDLSEQEVMQLLLTFEKLLKLD